MEFPKGKDILEGIVKREEKRQNESLNFIASENHIPAYIRAISGSVLMQKYAEGYPGKRYYPGTAYYDHIEKIAQERALELFGLSAKHWRVNVQPYSGAVANLEIYLSFLNPGDTILSLALKSGGHLSHGSKASFTGKLFHAEQYGVTGSYSIDYGNLKEKADKYKPKMIVSGASAYPGKIDFKRIKKIAESAGALHLADISHYAGLIAAGAYPSPFPYADVIMTTTHKSLFGPRGALIFSKKELSPAIDAAVFPGTQGGPHMHTIAGIAAGLDFVKINGPYFRQVVRNARAIAEELKKRGYELYGRGTDSHLILVNVSKKGIHGMQAEQMLEKCGIYANRNAVQGDVSVQKPSAIRFGTYAVTYRGMKEKEMKIIAELIDQALTGKNFYKNINSRVRKLCEKFPVPEN